MRKGPQVIYTCRSCEHLGLSFCSAAAVKLQNSPTLPVTPDDCPFKTRADIEDTLTALRLELAPEVWDDVAERIRALARERSALVAIARDAIPILRDYPDALTECECAAHVDDHLSAVVILRRRFERALRNAGEKVP